MAVVQFQVRAENNWYQLILLLQMKRMKKHILIGGFFTLLFLSGYSQNEVDALRYAFKQTPLTARSLGTGGAFGALGADLSSFYTNPGGIGMYKRGGVEFSLGLNDQFTETSYEGKQSQNGKTQLHLNSIGLIGSASEKSGDWKAFNFGVTYAKTNNFNENLTINGKSESSLLNPFVIQANGVHPDEISDAFPFTAGLAYVSWLINPSDSVGSSYYTTSSGENNQRKSINRSGTMGETAFGFGANYRDFIYFGASLNFQSIRFKETGNYSESYDSSQPITSFTYTDNLRSDGTGVGLKLGAIVKPSEWLRIGAAYHTPTRIVMHEIYNVEIRTTPDIGGDREYVSPDLITDYSVRTPSVTMANAAFILGKTGIITADYEYTSYDRIKMRGAATNDYDYSAENSVIKSIYRSTHKVRVGVEMRILGTYYVRGGAMYQQNPLVNNSGGVNNPFITYTGGLGFRNDYLCFDFGLGYTEKNSTYYMYDPRFVNAANFDTRLVQAIASFGYRF